MRNRHLPDAIRVFLWALIGAVVGAYGSFRLVLVIVDRFLPRIDPVVATILYFLVPLAVGTATAVTAGVVAGKSLKG